VGLSGFLFFRAYWWFNRRFSIAKKNEGRRRGLIVVFFERMPLDRQSCQLHVQNEKLATINETGLCKINKT
jgi:hypothetical protein